MKKFLKRSLSLFLTITIIFSSAIVGLSEGDFSSCFNTKALAVNENIFEFNVDSAGKVYLQSCDSDASGEIVVPATYNGKPVSYIGSGAFGHCVNITGIVISDSVTSIGIRAFQNCYNLKSVKFGKGLKNICDFAFCLTAIENVVLPEGLETIGNYAFYSSHSIKSVTIPKSLKSIGENAFCGCELLEDVYISDMAAWCNIEFAEYDSNPMLHANNLYLNGTLVKNVVIPEGVKAIPSYAFYSENITSVTISSSVTSISDTAFYECKKITSINVDKNNSVYSSANGVLFNKDKTILILYPVANTRTSYVIPDSVVTIGNKAFCYCENLVSVTFGKN